ncbi:MAG TPA: lysophospholipid acyltransferase family protein [Acidobacteriota bacterium]|nr:lysophospholipid acyltransferase family protein [Acidobacteriota bacterium]
MDSYPVYLLARLIMSFLRAVPRATGTRLVRFLASIFYYLDARHRHIADVNLTIAFPGWSAKKRSRIARASFQNAAMNLLEVSRMPHLTAETISSLVVYDESHGLDNYRAARGKGTGILYLTGHFSAWELLPAAHALHGFPLSFITRPLDNQLLETFLRGIRESKGNHVIYKKNSARQVLKALNADHDVGILMDQNTGLNEGVFSDFFGIPAATSASVALFALRTNAPVLPGYLTAMKDGRYRIKFLAPIEVARTGDMEYDIKKNTRLFNDVLETIVREQPEAWLWGHRRWKYQPEGNPRDLYRLSPEELSAFLEKTRNRGSHMS